MHSSLDAKKKDHNLGFYCRVLFVDPTVNIKIHFLRYGLVAGVAFAVDFGLLYIFTSWLNIYYLFAAILSFTISVGVNYLLSIAWVFSARDPKKRSIEVTLFLLICLVALFLNIFLIWILTSVFLIYYLLSKIIAVIFVFFWSFGARRFIFHSRFMRKHFPNLILG